MTQRLLDEFKEHVRDNGMTVDEEAFASDSNFIKAMIHFQVDIDLFGEAEARKNLFEVDPQAQFALTLFDEATSLLKLSNTSTLVAAR